MNAKKKADRIAQLKGQLVTTVAALFAFGVDVDEIDEIIDDIYDEDNRKGSDSPFTRQV